MQSDTFDIPEHETIDQGVYNAVVTKVERKTIETGPYAGNTIRIWSFNVDVDGTTAEVTASSSLNTGPRSKSYQWLSAILGHAPSPGETGLNPVGHPCLVHLIVDDESGYNKVAAVLPAEKGQRPVPGAGPPEAIDGDLPPMEEPPIYDREDLP